MTGKIIKGIAGFYYIHTPSGVIYACKARGIFRKDGTKPLVGDDVLFDVTHEGDKEGNITEILPRHSQLIRPAVANVDQALIVFAIREPDPNFNLLDKFLVNMSAQDIPVVIYFNKQDIDDANLREKYRNVYEKAGYRVITGSTFDETTLSEILEVLHGRTTVLAGPSGVGKSSLTNRIYTNAGMEVGELSEKIKRGKQTTRHTELFSIDEESYILDTPGFTSLYVSGVSSDSLRYYYDEFEPFGTDCRFNGCSHVNEPMSMCAVKQAVKRGDIARLRYDNYCYIYREIKDSENRY